VTRVAVALVMLVIAAGIVVEAAWISHTLQYGGLTHADTRSDVCTANRLGETPSEIAEGLQRGDARENQRRAWNDTIWPILEGQCDNN
jgi:hypothetical protein